MQPWRKVDSEMYQAIYQKSKTGHSLSTSSWSRAFSFKHRPDLAVLLLSFKNQIRNHLYRGVVCFVRTVLKKYRKKKERVPYTLWGGLPPPPLPRRIRCCIYAYLNDKLFWKLTRSLHTYPAEAKLFGSGCWSIPKAVYSTPAFLSSLFLYFRDPQSDYIGNLLPQPKTFASARWGARNLFLPITRISVHPESRILRVPVCWKRKIG